MAQMELYRKHGINPLGSCWMMFLQMPVFLGLYYCLQESIHFRLAPFSVDQEPDRPGHAVPLGRQDPVHQRAGSNYGAMFYLGPYFNVLPVMAVVADDRPAEVHDAAGRRTSRRRCSRR